MASENGKATSLSVNFYIFFFNRNFNKLEQLMIGFKL